VKQPSGYQFTGIQKAQRITGPKPFLATVGDWAPMAGAYATDPLRVVPGEKYLDLPGMAVSGAGAAIGERIRQYLYAVSGERPLPPQTDALAQMAMTGAEYAAFQPVGRFIGRQLDRIMGKLGIGGRLSLPWYRESPAGSIGGEGTLLGKGEARAGVSVRDLRTLEGAAEPGTGLEAYRDPRAANVELVPRRPATARPVRSGIQLRAGAPSPPPATPSPPEGSMLSELTGRAARTMGPLMRQLKAQPIAAVQGVVRDLLSPTGMVKRSIRGIGEAVASAAKAGPDVDIETLQDEVREILRREIRPPERAFPRQPGLDLSTKPPGALSLAEQIAQAQGDVSRQKLGTKTAQWMARVLAAKPRVKMDEAWRFRMDLDEAMGDKVFQDLFHGQSKGQFLRIRGSLQDLLEGTGYQPFILASRQYHHAMDLVRHFVTDLGERSQEHPEEVTKMLRTAVVSDVERLKETLHSYGGSQGPVAWRSLQKSWILDRAGTGPLSRLPQRLKAIPKDLWQAWTDDPTGRPFRNGLESLARSIEDARQVAQIGPGGKPPVYAEESTAVPDWATMDPETRFGRLLRALQAGGGVYAHFATGMKWAHSFLSPKRFITAYTEHDEYRPFMIEIIRSKTFERAIPHALRLADALVRTADTGGEDTEPLAGPPSGPPQP